MKKSFITSAIQCCDNARRLLDEAEILEFEEPPATRLYLSMISQEEAAKAFLLHLVAVEALPWTPLLLRAMRDHQCKQLVAIILDYMSDMDALLRSKSLLNLPVTVADAMNILCHEKIRRWESKNWVWVEEPEYDKTAQRVVDGVRDKEKQRALYVEIGRTGQVATVPTRETVARSDEEFRRGCRIERCTRGLLEAVPYAAWDCERIVSCFRALFSESNESVKSLPS